jgi:Flp pilus assembly protein TadD
MSWSRREKLLAGTAGFVALNSVYLASRADASIFYYSNVLAHIAAGLAACALAAPFLRRFRAALKEASAAAGGAPVPAAARALRPIGEAAIALLGLGALSGAALVFTGASRPLAWLLAAHIASSVLGALALGHALFELARRAGGPGAEAPRLEQRRLAVLAALFVAIGIPFAAAAFEARANRRQAHIVNDPQAPLDMAEEAMGGKAGPFFPSSIRTTHGGRIPSDFFLTSESCGRSGCHPDILKQWQSSAHRFSSFNNQWYRKSIEYMQDTIGVQSSKWCAGCHDVAVLLNGMFDRPVREILDTPEAQAGLACTACHAIVNVKSTMGQGDYEIEYPPLHRLAASENRFLQIFHDFLVKVDPEPHRRAFLKPFHKSNAEFCSSCHKVHLDEPVNNYRWIRGFNEYDNWQASAVSGQGARSFYYPPKPQVCADCHMPMVPSRDAGHVGGLVHSHRFPAANTALPVANQDEEQLRVVTEFLQNRQVTLDVFAVSEGEAGGVQEEVLQAPEEALEPMSTFAVGEEQASPVGRGGGTSLPEAEPILAPIDRAQAAVRRGRSSRVDVVVRTRGVGHFFPGGTVDAFEVWVELKAADSNGRVLFWSGGVADEAGGRKGPVDPGSHFYRSFMLDGRGNPINKRNAWATRSLLYVRLIPPGAADTIRFRLNVPEDAGERIDLEARLHYRKFAWWNTQWAFAGVRDPSQGAYDVTPHHDDGKWVFTGDTSGVSGALKAIPDLPIVTMAEARASLRVLPRDAPMPPHEPVLDAADRERWNDYGIGLLLQGDLKAAERAFRVVTQIEPGYADGWVNIGRTRIQEGDLPAAQEALDKALELSPDLPRALFFRAMADKAKGEYDAALERLRRAVAAYPRDRVVLNQIGRILFLKRDYAGAVKSLEDVLRIDPEDLQAHYNLMLSYRGLGDKDKAEREQALYLRFKADEAAQAITGEYRRQHPYDNLERQRIHEHASTFTEREGAGAGYGAAGAGGGR